MKALNCSKEPKLGIFSFSPTSSDGICKKEKRWYVIFMDRSAFWQVMGGKNIEFMCFLLSFGLVKVNLHPECTTFFRQSEPAPTNAPPWMDDAWTRSFFSWGSCCPPSLHIDEGFLNVLEIPNLVSSKQMASNRKVEFMCSWVLCVSSPLDRQLTLHKGGMIQESTGSYSVVANMSHVKNWPKIKSLGEHTQMSRVSPTISPCLIGHNGA